MYKMELLAVLLVPEVKCLTLGAIIGSNFNRKLAVVVKSIKLCISCNVKESRENELPVPATLSICLHVLYFSLQVTLC